MTHLVIEYKFYIHITVQRLSTDVGQIIGHAVVVLIWSMSGHMVFIVRQD